METTEKIVESYCRYIRNFFTISNVKIKNGEIDILAIDIMDGERIEKYHIEVSVSIAAGFSKLTADEYDSGKYSEIRNRATQRRTIGYFINRKFDQEEHIGKLEELGFKKGQYKKVIVSWGWTSDAENMAKENGIELWDFREILGKIGESFKDMTTYFPDDTLRTLQLYVRAMEQLNNKE